MIKVKVLHPGPYYVGNQRSKATQLQEGDEAVFSEEYFKDLPEGLVEAVDSGITVEVTREIVDKISAVKDHINKRIGEKELDEATKAKLLEDALKEDEKLEAKAEEEPDVDESKEEDTEDTKKKAKGRGKK